MVALLDKGRNVMRWIFGTGLLLALALGLAACGGGGPRVAAPVPPGEVTRPNFSDTNPHPWDGRAPAQYPVHGVDVSRFQTNVDWATARANGVNFAFIKATEGGDLLDVGFKDHWRKAGQAGVQRGAYHFWYHCRPADEQARWFIRHVPKGGLPPVLDMEWTPFSPTCTIRKPAAEIRASAAEYMNLIAAHYGQRPILYTTVDFYRENEMWRLSGNEFWLRSVTAHPAERYEGQAWTFWQYTGTGLVPGFSGQTDINVFNGSEARWQQWLAARLQ
jgi:lysozyme